jgi:hypothetical protein
MDLPADLQIRWILRRTATLLSLGAEPVRGLVTPTPEFFPDHFDGSPKSVAALLARVQEHAGLSHLDAELAIVTPEGEQQSVGSCSSGACGAPAAIASRQGRLARRDDGSYVVAVGAGEVKSPVILTTALARAAAAMFMVESSAFEAMTPAEREPATDLAAALLGFGVLVANGSYIYAKGCGGVQVHSATTMPVDELTLALAIFCKLHGVSDRACAKHLALTPRAHFDEAAVWASSNAPVVRMLRADPSVIEADDFKLGSSRSWLARVLGVGKKAAVTRATDDDLASLELSLKSAPQRAAGPGDAAKARRIAEIRALVDESLDQG